MDGYDQLTWFSIGLIVLWVGTIIVPYLNGKAHLFSIWNFFLVGSIVFVGLANLTLTQGWDEEWSRYTDTEVQDLMLGLSIFYLTAYAFYYLFGPSRVCGRTLLVWPKTTKRTLVFFSIVCIASTIFFYLPFNIPVISQIAKQFSIKSIGFAIVMVFVAWFRDRQNPFLVTLLVGFLLYSLLFSITVGGGRRTFITAVSGIPIAMYFIHFRKVSKTKTILIFTFLAAFLMTLLVAYGEIRHRGRRKTARDLSYALETLRMLPSRFFEGDGKQLLGQHATECSMLTRKAFRNKPQPFALGTYVLTNPIPRSLWPEKPLGLGYILPKAVGSKTRATWGPGIVGHAFHEGSHYFLILYGGIFAIFIRMCDEWLARQPENPILIGTAVAIFPHVLGWVRGDCGTFTIQIIAGVMTAFFIYWLLWVYGRGVMVNAKRTDDLTMEQAIKKNRSSDVVIAYYDLGPQRAQNLHRRYR